MVASIAPSADPSKAWDLTYSPSATLTASIGAPSKAVQLHRRRPIPSRRELSTTANQLPYLPNLFSDGFVSIKGNYGPNPNYVGSTLRPLNTKPHSVYHFSA